MKKIVASLSSLSFLLLVGLQQATLAQAVPPSRNASAKTCLVSSLDTQSNLEKTKGAIAQSGFTQRPRMELKVEGGTATPVPASRAGLSFQALPGVKRVSVDQWASMKAVPKTGLYLVETQFVPQELPKFLQREGYTLKADGTLLDKKGKPITLFVKSEVFQVNRKNKSAQVVAQAGTKSVSTVDGTLAANPYPFSWFSWSMWWRYDGGFCRDYNAWTTAEAWGPMQGGARPHTRIQYMETRASVGSRSDRDSCFNCDNESSYAKRDIGCFWPAHGGSSGSHYANWKDGGFSATRTWSWTH